jgi:hypothetical protein
MLPLVVSNRSLVTRITFIRSPTIVGLVVTGVDRAKRKKSRLGTGSWSRGRIVTVREKPEFVL